MLVHGFLGSGEFWKSYIGDFAKHFKLIIPDLSHVRLREAEVKGEMVDHRSSRVSEPKVAFLCLGITESGR